MTTTGFENFDKGIQKANLWLHWIMKELHSEDQQQAYHALRATLHTLRDRLTVNEAADLGAQLPILIRGIYYEGWDPSNTPLKIRGKEEFLQMVQSRFAVQDIFDPERIVTTVFRLLNEKISVGELQDIQGMLPEDLRDLWPETVGTGSG